jgi:hypothetical protein
LIQAALALPSLLPVRDIPVDLPAFILRFQAFDYTLRRPVPVFHPYSLDQVRRSIHRPAQVF